VNVGEGDWKLAGTTDESRTVRAEGGAWKLGRDGGEAGVA
jgi:hypothetical protein